MKARTRNLLSVLSGLYIVVVGLLFTRVPLPTFNVLLAAVAVPLVWLIGAFARWSAYQHSRRWARDIAKVHGPTVQRPRAGVR